MSLFSIDHIAFSVLNYPVSYIELIATVSGLISVIYASRANILTWPTGIVNELALFVLFFQVQLYADMLLQAYFFVVTIYGWWHWRQKTESVAITTLKPRARLYVLLLLIVGSVAIGFFISHIHTLLPHWFPKPAAYPFADSFVMTGSMLATVLLARKQLENWIIWILVDIVGVLLYGVKGIYFLGVEYLIFLGLAIFGLLQWKAKLRHD
jgi:nicotinamide mononucleotide transporter